MSKGRLRVVVTVGCWLAAFLLSILNLLTPQVAVADIENYWDTWPFSLKHKNVRVRASLISTWPYDGSQSLWQKALDSAVDDMDSNTNLTVGYGAAANSVMATYIPSVSNLTKAMLYKAAETTWESYNPTTGISIDCAKNYYAPNAWQLPQCGLEENLVTNAQVHINTAFLGYDPNSNEFKELNMSNYTLRRRVVTHELMHVPGHGHTTCDISSVTKIHLDCSGQRELTGHDTSWINLRYP